MKLKICGLMTLQDIQAVNAVSGVDYAGFVFTRHRQQISINMARTLKNELNPNIKTIGVFVDEPQDYVQLAVDELSLDMVQFHGRKEYALNIPTVKAMLMQSKDDIKPTWCDFVLFDTFRDGTRGSTGGMFDWRLIEDYAANPAEKPFFLAGGINITNIHDAMKFNPYCIDVSSGVEINGIKCYNKIKELSLCIKRYCQK